MNPKATVLALLAAGCSFYARGPDDYRKATRKLLEDRTSDVQSCYMRQLERDAQAAGSVTVQFRVAPKTGDLLEPKVVGGETSPELQQCVLDSLSGLKLDPPDQRAGDATFTWKFARAGG